MCAIGLVVSRLGGTASRVSNMNVVVRRPCNSEGPGGEDALAILGLLRLVTSAASLTGVGRGTSLRSSLETSATGTAGRALCGTYMSTA